MQISINNVSIDLSSDELEATINNPLFSNMGDQTLPISVPASERNLEIMQHPDRMDNMNAKLKFDATLHLGEVNKPASFDILTADATGIDGTLYFGTGDFYASIKDTRLIDIDYSVIDPYFGTFEEKATQMLNHLMDVANEKIEADYHIFPILAEYSPGTEADAISTGTILNETEDNGGDTEIFVAYNVRNKIIDQVDVAFPIGYGVTPFIKLHSLVRFVFNHFGYELETNPFYDDFQLSKLVLLNNTADTIVRGSIDYKHIVPDCTVAELLELIHARGYVLYVRQNARKAYFKRLDTIFLQSADVELRQIVSEVKIVYEKPKRLVLKGGVQSESEPTFDSEAGLIRSYKQFGSFISRTELEFNNIAATANYYNVVRLATGDYYNMLTGPVNSPFAFIKKVSSPYFVYEEEGTGGMHEINSPEEIVGVDFPIITDYPVRLYPMYLLGLQHFNSEVRMQDGTILEEQVNNNRKLALCFAYGRARLSDGSPDRWFYGSTQRYDNMGNEQPDCWLSLQFTGADGVYQHYYREFERFLKIGVKVEFSIKIEDYEIERLDLSVPKRLKNQEILIESIDYEFGKNLANVVAWLKR